jgi:uncharacterized protein YdeI (YjbR/CyaY-like superfamily)
MSRDPRIDAYLAAAAPFAQPILRHLRELVHRACPGAVETIKWGMPFFTYHDRLFCHFAAFKAHAAFGLHHRAIEKQLQQEGRETDGAMGLFGRLTGPKDLPPDRTILRYLRTARELHDAGKPVRPKARPRPALPTPADFAAALRLNQPAAAQWAEFSPSHRRDYLEWITEAKRPATRATRLATALSWIAEGKSRNWKYERR